MQLKDWVRLVLYFNAKISQHIPFARPNANAPGQQCQKYLQIKQEKGGKPEEI